MRAILIGGPRHLTEFEIGNNPPHIWLVPNMEPVVTVQDFLMLREANAHFDTVTYYRRRNGIAGYAIYTLNEHWDSE